MIDPREFDENGTREVLRVEQNIAGMGTVIRIMHGDVLLWSHNSIEGPFPHQDMLRKLVELLGLKVEF